MGGPLSANRDVNFFGSCLAPRQWMMPFTPTFSPVLKITRMSPDDSYEPLKAAEPGRGWGAIPPRHVRTARRLRDLGFRFHSVTTISRSKQSATTIKNAFRLKPAIRTQPRCGRRQGGCVPERDWQQVWNEPARSLAASAYARFVARIRRSQRQYHDGL